MNLDSYLPNDLATTLSGDKNISLTMLNGAYVTLPYFKLGTNRRTQINISTQ